MRGPDFGHIKGHDRHTSLPLSVAFLVRLMKVQSVCVFLFDGASNHIMIPFLDNKNRSYMRVFLS